MHLASKQGDVEMLRVLKDFDADFNSADGDGYTPALIVIWHGHVGAIRVLHECGADFLSVKMKDGTGDTPVHLASRAGYEKSLIELHKLSANMNAQNVKGETPLHNACAEGRLHALHVLLTRGAIVNAKMDDEGLTPAHVAIRRGHVEALQHLCTASADVDARTTDGATLAHLASHYGHSSAERSAGSAEAVRLLHKFKADLNQIQINLNANSKKLH